MTRSRAITLRAAGAITVPTTEYGLFGTQKVSSTTTGTTSNKLVDTAGNFSNLGVVVGDVIKNTSTGKYATVTAVDSATQLSVSADNFVSGNTYVIYPGLGYDIAGDGGVYKELTAILNLTAAATDAGDTLDVYLDTSYDNGATWVNLGHFTQCLGNGGAKKYVLTICPTNPGTSVIDVSADASAGAQRQIGFGTRFRYRSVVVDASTQNVSFNYTLTLVLKT